MANYKHRTSLFGIDSENYFSRLFMMLKNPNGSRRPDFVTTKRDFTPPLSIELKSGRKQKGILVDYQLHYAITSYDDYSEIFGDEPPQIDSVLPGMEEIKKAQLRMGDIAYYYDILNRTDEISAQELNKPFSTINLQWGDHHIIPHEMGFYCFAIGRGMRTGEAIPNIVEELRDMMKKDVDSGSDYYGYRKGKKQSWQNLHARDISAIFQDNMDLATKDGKKRIELLWENYKPLNELRKLEIPGPNKTKIYVLAEPSHEDLFDKQVRKVIEERTPIIEKITRERKRARGLLNKISSSENYLFDEELPKKSEYSVDNLTPSEIKRLRRLSSWLGYKENALTIKDSLPEKPDDKIPF